MVTVDPSYSPQLPQHSIEINSRPTSLHHELRVLESQAAMWMFPLLANLLFLTTLLTNQRVEHLLHMRKYAVQGNSKMLYVENEYRNQEGAI